MVYAWHRRQPVCWRRLSTFSVLGIPGCRRWRDKVAITIGRRRGGAKACDSCENKNQCFLKKDCKDHRAVKGTNRTRRGVCDRLENGWGKIKRRLGKSHLIKRLSAARRRRRVGGAMAGLIGGVAAVTVNFRSQRRRRRELESCT